MRYPPENINAGNSQAGIFHSVLSSKNMRGVITDQFEFYLGAPNRFSSYKISPKNPFRYLKQNKKVT